MITVTNSHYDYISLFVGKQRKNKQISAFTDVCVEAFSKTLKSLNTLRWSFSQDDK